MSKQTKLSETSLQSELNVNLENGLLRFFNGDTIEKIVGDLKHIEETTITESYGELDKDDKWQMIDFFRRLKSFIEGMHSLFMQTKNEFQNNGVPG